MQITSGGVDVSLVRGFLKVLREGRIYIARVTRSGRNGRYAYLLIPLALLKTGIEPGSRFRVEIHRDHIDYVVDPSGQYKLTISSGHDPKIRFPASIRGYVIVEPLPDGRGFRVYY